MYRLHGDYVLYVAEDTCELDSYFSAWISILKASCTLRFI